MNLIRFALFIFQVVDGWELQGDFFPGIQDHPKSLNERFHEFCGSHKPNKYYFSSQNVAMIQYRIPIKGEGFQVTVTFIENLTRKLHEEIIKIMEVLEKFNLYLRNEVSNLEYQFQV